MRNLLLTILLVFCLPFLSISQKTESLFFTHDLGNFYLYVNGNLIERAPLNQVSYESNGISKLMVKIVFQDHNLKPITREIKIQKNRTQVFVIYTHKGATKFDKHEKIKLGQYKPGFLPLPHTAMPKYTGRLGCEFPTDEEMSLQLAQRIKNEMNAMAQMTMARELVVNNCITVSGLTLVLNAFSYESDKVEFAKYAWAYIYDQENFMQLNTVFQYPQTLDEINSFVQSNQ